MKNFAYAVADILNFVVILEVRRILEGWYTFINTMHYDITEYCCKHRFDVYVCTKL